MSDFLPFEIQLEILKRLPVQALIRFRSVSKTWKAHIDSSDFIAHYRGHQQHVFLQYDAVGTFERNYVSIADDDTFPQHKVSVTPHLLVNKLKNSRIVGSSHGLLCLEGICLDPHDDRVHALHMAVLWNISIRKAVAICVPNVGSGLYQTVLGFGVCGETSDLKIVKIAYIASWRNVDRTSCIPRQVEVFTLSTGAWRSPYSSSNSHPRKSIDFSFGCSQQVIDGIIYWLATEWITMDGEARYNNLLISFDLTSEEFKEVNLPSNLALNQTPENLILSTLRKSLIVFELDENEMGYIVWRMEDDVPKSSTKLFHIYNKPDARVSSPINFTRSGEPIIVIDEPGGWSLGFYEPHSKHINHLVTSGMGHGFSVYPYMETLFLLGQPDHYCMPEVTSHGKVES